jgi:hypothetical protein
MGYTNLLRDHTSGSTTRQRLEKEKKNWRNCVFSLPGVVRRLLKYVEVWANSVDSLNIFFSDSILFFQPCFFFLAEHSIVCDVCKTLLDTCCIHSVHTVIWPFVYPTRRGVVAATYLCQKPHDIALVRAQRVNHSAECLQCPVACLHTRVPMSLWA